MIDDKKLVANSEKLLAKIYEVNDNRLPEELFLEVSSVIISINRFKREKVLHERPVSYTHLNLPTKQPV